MIMSNSVQTNNQQSDKGMHPKVFMMLIGMISMSMLFVALTSALIVKKSDTVLWKNFTLPLPFMISTLFIILSSITLQVSFNWFKKGDSRYKPLMGVTFVLSIIFCVFQVLGWNTLSNMGLKLSGNVSGSFVYVVTGFHLAHLFGGMTALLITYIIHLIKTRNSLEEIKLLININKRVNFQVLLIFWHFLGGLWIYLFSFLYLIYS